ncbi:MAG: hypothetical protein HY343_01890 [Lentisphaerae bacterium]|nr:hypothetical protein [Lentisphaerota bacterium]
MKRTYTFAKSRGWIRCVLPTGREIRLPVFQGILKHPTAEALPALLKHPATARKYTREALRVASWPVLRQFPSSWLKTCMKTTPLRPGRRKALDFMLS